MELGILGPLLVTVGGVPAEVRAPKQRALLALLVLHADYPARAVSPTRAVDALWGEDGAAGGESTVYVYVSRLRRVLGSSVISRKPHGYALAVAPEQIDSHGFERLMAAGRSACAAGHVEEGRAALGEALALWRGPALAEFRGWPWADGPAERLEEQRLVGLETRIDLDLALGDAADLVGELESLVSEHPYRERFTGQLMLAQYRAGRQADALRAFADLRDRLREELGLVPSAPLRSLEHAILVQAPELEQPPVTPRGRRRDRRPHGSAGPPGTAGGQRPHLPLVGEGERKLATVVCLLPSKSAELPAALLDAIAHTMRRLGGQPARLDATAMVWTFGVARAEEDHAHRAVLAAWAARGVGRGVAGDIAVGLHCGPVTVGSRGGDDTIATTRRFAQKAEPGEIIVSPAAAHLLRRHAELTPSPDGESHVVRAVGTRSAVEVFALATTGPFVGRQLELTVLDDLLERAKAGEGQVVGFSGEAGMGKSRLLFELSRRLEGQSHRWIGGHSASHQRSTPYFAIGNAIRDAAGLRSDDDATTLTAKLQRAVESVGGPPEWATILGHVLGDRPDTAGDELTPAARRARTFDVVRRFVLRAARQRVVVLALEDLHWIDPSSEELLASIVDAAERSRLLVLTTYRPGYKPPWIARSSATQLRLRPLSAADGLELLHGLSEGSLPEHVTKTILERAEGNPFYIEELWRATTSALGLPESVPDTLRGVIQARIDDLDEGPRRLLQLASVLGRSFPSELLEVARGRGAPIESLLGELRQRELISDAEVDGAPGHVFRHVLTQEVAYETLPPSRRNSFHLAAAQALEATHADDLDRVAAELARHYGGGGRPDLAVRWWRRVAGRAAQRHAHLEALAALGEARRHAEVLPRARRDRALVEVLTEQAGSLFLLGRLPEIRALLDGERALLDSVADPALAGPWHLWLAHVHSMSGDRRRAQLHAAEALAAAHSCHDRETVGRAHYVLAVEGLASSELRSGVEQGRQAIELLGGTNARYWLGLSCWVTGYQLILVGDFDEALPLLQRCLAVGETIGDPRLAAYAGYSAAFALALRGDTAAALSAAEVALERARDPYTRAVCKAHLGCAALEAGLVERAVRELEPACEWLEQAGFRQIASMMLAYLAEARCAAGHVDSAAELGLAAMSAMEQYGFEIGVGHSQRVLSRVARARGDAEEARRRLHASADAYTSSDATFELGRTLLELAHLETACGDAESARRALRQSIGHFERSQAPRYVARAQAALNDTTLLGQGTGS